MQSMPGTVLFNIKCQVKLMVKKLYCCSSRTMVVKVGAQVIQEFKSQVSLLAKNIVEHGEKVCH